MSDTPQYRRNDEILFGQSGTDTFLMSAESGLYYALNETASRLWQILDQPCGEDEIVAALVAEYRVDPARCRGEIGPFLSDLVERTILLVS